MKNSVGNIVFKTKYFLEFIKLFQLPFGYFFKLHKGRNKYKCIYVYLKLYASYTEQQRRKAHGCQIQKGFICW